MNNELPPPNHLRQHCARCNEWFTGIRRHTLPDMPICLPCTIPAAWEVIEGTATWANVQHAKLQSR